MQMRVLHVAESFGAGVFEVVRVLAARLTDQGHAVAIAYGFRPETPPDPRAAVDRRVELFTTPWTSRTPQAQVAAGRRLRSLVAAWRPDVVHLHSSFAGIVGATALAGRVPLVYSPHGYAFLRRDEPAAWRRAYALMERYVSSRCDLVGAVSQAEARLARKVTRARNVAVVPNGIPDLDPGRRPALRTAPPAVPVVVAMGRIEPARRPEGAARILGAIADMATVRWIGGGDATAERELRRQGVEVTGWLEHERALELLGQASAYLHWSAWDSHPLAVLEAMARDVPVVASDIPANRELVGEEQVRERESDAAALLRRLLGEPWLRDQVLASQRARAERFTTLSMASAWARAYRALILPRQKADRWSEQHDPTT